MIRYFNRLAAKEETGVLYNLQTGQEDRQTIETEFLRNYAYAQKRRNGVVLYHEILSFADKDARRVTPDILRDVAIRYLNIRAPNAMAYGKIHLDKRHPHIHLLISGNQIKSAAQMRISRRRFQQIKLAIERYQRQQYPALNHSIVLGTSSKSKRIKRTIAEDEREKRLSGESKKQTSRKELARQKVKRCLGCFSREEFLRNLQAAGFALYVRGRAVGVVEVATGQKYRLKTIGLADDYGKACRLWKQIPARRQVLAEIERAKFYRQYWELEKACKNEIFETIVCHQDGEINRQKELKKIMMINQKQQQDKEHGRSIFDEEIGRF